MTIPNIPQINTGIPRITVNGTGIPFIRAPWVRQSSIRQLGNVYVTDVRTWEMTPHVTNGIDVPVTVYAGTPIIDMPGCVKVHKENVRDQSRNKNLVNDDPKGNVVLCDAGMPYYEPPNYDARELTWQTVTPDQGDQEEGVDTGDPDLSTPETPGAPDTPTTDGGPVECPPPNARRIGDRNQKGDEQVKEYKLTPDGKLCETIWEPVPAVEQYLPSVGIVTTTATIATVATASALFAKPLADLLLKAVKPAIKKAMTKIQKILGKKEERRPNLQERQTEKYREKKGLPPLKKKG